MEQWLPYYNAQSYYLFLKNMKILIQSCCKCHITMLPRNFVIQMSTFLFPCPKRFHWVWKYLHMRFHQETNVLRTSYYVLISLETRTLTIDLINWRKFDKIPSLYYFLPRVFNSKFLNIYKYV